MQKIYDLHCHSTASDGVLSPKEVVQRAYDNNVSVLALTDHDSISGLDEAQEHSDLLGIKLITGVEISTQWENRAIHIVGLNFDRKHPKMISLLQEQAEKRLFRAIEIGNKLNQLGVENAFEGAKKFTDGEVTRAHYARYLVEIGKVSNINQAFKKYLSQGKFAYVKTQWVDIPSAIDIIHQAGGLAVLAHPLRYTLTTKWIKKLIVDFSQSGGDAIEVAGCGQTKDQRLLLAHWATEFKLYGSVGSDFHFPCGWIELGHSLELPDNVMPIWQKFDI